MPGDWGFIGWIIIGGLAGFLASRVMGTSDQQGCLLDIVVGVVGAVIGGFLVNSLIGFGEGGFIWTLLTAFIGAVILLWAWKRLGPGPRAR